MIALALAAALTATCPSTPPVAKVCGAEGVGSFGPTYGTSFVYDPARCRSAADLLPRSATILRDGADCRVADAGPKHCVERDGFHACGHADLQARRNMDAYGAEAMTAPYTKTTAAYGPLPTETCDIYLPPETGATGAPTKPTPVVFLIHGGAWISGSGAQFEPGSGYTTQKVATWCAEHGMAAVVINYPLHVWQNGGSGANMGEIIDAVKAAISYVKGEAAKRYSIDPSKTAAWGMSAGGEIASFLGVRGIVKAVIADSAPEDLSSIATLRGVIDQFAPTPWEQRYWSPPTT